MAVVDHELRVHGLEGLRIADASIMPTVVSGNTNAACIMIGEKCAEMMLAVVEQGATGRDIAPLRSSSGPLMSGYGTKPPPHAIGEDDRW